MFIVYHLALYEQILHRYQQIFTFPSSHSQGLETELSPENTRSLEDSAIKGLKRKVNKKYREECKNVPDIDSAAAKSETVSLPALQMWGNIQVQLAFHLSRAFLGLAWNKTAFSQNSQNVKKKEDYKALQPSAHYNVFVNNLYPLKVYPLRGPEFWRNRN